MQTDTPKGPKSMNKISDLVFAFRIHPVYCEIFGAEEDM